MTDELLQFINDQVLTPALAMLPPAFDSQLVRVHLLADGLQESELAHRVQIIDGGGRGPAHGLWQFERAGGVLGVLSHKASRAYAWRVCDARGVPADSRAVWERLEHDDILAAVFARLLIWTDPYKLPGLDDEAGAYQMYCERLWRPGKPRPSDWPANWRRARDFILAGGAAC